MTATLAIRTASAADAPAVARLAALDSQPVPAGLLLLAEQDGDLVAAHAHPGGAVLADPFRHTREARAVLAAAAEARRAGGREARPGRPLALRLRPRPA